MQIMKYLIVSILCCSVLFFSNCSKNNNDAAGSWEFSINYVPDGGTTWSESGTGEVSVDGSKFTVNVKMSTGEDYVREGELDGEKVIIVGSYTQPLASDPSTNETVTYDGEGTFDGTTLEAEGTYVFKIPTYTFEETGKFYLSATKK